MGPLESAKKVAAYKAVDEFVKVISILSNCTLIAGYINSPVFHCLNFAHYCFTE